MHLQKKKKKKKKKKIQSSVPPPPLLPLHSFSLGCGVVWWGRGGAILFVLFCSFVCMLFAIFASGCRYCNVMLEKMPSRRTYKQEEQISNTTYN